ncbi:uncharacterized protein LOC129582055 [Paramacrobiotus metropolitanus]|uniref:uncharacterized protein LOC129582055 n=1 Tax=Paramacrobiotus metropolitanus TaxID=2943436 RepID=UPI0024457C16|nr:uncharacterized protein LOC129582055 [Paramacrobiotus metropolitanus]
MSRIFYLVLRHIDHNFSQLLHSLDRPWLNEESLTTYAAAIEKKGGTVKNCFGFIDGTARPICRPKRLQRDCFGLIRNLFGGVRSTMHDARMLNESGLLESLRTQFANFDEKLVLYGDSGYGKKDILITPHS